MRTGAVRSNSKPRTTTKKAGRDGRIMGLGTDPKIQDFLERRREFQSSIINLVPFPRSFFGTPCNFKVMKTPLIEVKRYGTRNWTVYARKSRKSLRKLRKTPDELQKS